MCTTLGGSGSNCGGTVETGGFDGGAGIGGAGVFDSVNEAAIFVPVVTGFSVFSATGAFAPKGIEVRSGTSTLLGVTDTDGGSGLGFSSGGAVGFAGGHLATRPS